MATYYSPDQMENERNKKGRYSSKKVGFIVGFSIIFLVAIIIGIIFFLLTHNGAYTTALEFIQTSVQVEDKLGDVEHIGKLFSGHLSIENDQGEADYIFNVTGSKAKGKVHIYLYKLSGEDWEIEDFSINKTSD